ncbi:MAG: pseudouridine synthase [Gammaproteobacteria bacterium]|nr:pseudouridine synthase [Gammaproteobacteria bacterium]
MSILILLNKPFQVLSQFTTDGQKQTLKEYVPFRNVYPAGRLDYDSEGLLLLTDDGKLQHNISDPKYNKNKTYWVQVENIPEEKDLDKLRKGMRLKDGFTKPAKVKMIDEPANLWPRNPPIRERKNIPDQWLEISITEGKNRQVRRMVAAINHPALRLIRSEIDQWSIAGIAPGEYKKINV